MAARLTHGRKDLLIKELFTVKGLIALIGVHSCVLAITMLFAPGFMLRTFGFPPQDSIFFPSQSGVFLLILGICYLMALVEPAFVKIIVLSKAFAVAFLFVHVVFLDAPISIWAALAVDSTMLVILAVALSRRNHQVHERQPQADIAAG